MKPERTLEPQPEPRRLHQVGPAAPADLEEAPELQEYLDAVYASRYLVLAATLLAGLIGGAYAFLTTPSYESDVIVQVEEKKSGGVLQDLSAMMGEKSPAETEMEILRSRTLLADVAQRLALDVEAEPVRFPLFGDALARRYKGTEVAPARFGLDSYAWGGERVRIGRFETPADLLGESFTLVAGPESTFSLLDPDGAPLLQGTVGNPASGRGVSLFVTELEARPGTRFTVRRNRMDEVVKGLQRDVRIGEKGRKTGVIRVALEGESPKRIAEVLDTIANRYVAMNVERRSAEAEKMLQFLESQIPTLRARAAAAEDELEAYRSKNNVDVKLETQAIVDRGVETEKALQELELKALDLRERFTASHPTLAAVHRQIAELQAERGRLEGRLKLLPKSELEAARLTRDVQVANELYVLLLNKSQELQVVKSGTIGTVRVLDAAIVPWKPVSPRKAASLVIALFLGLAGGIAIALVRRALEQGVDDPEKIERDLGLPVFASIPLSPRQRELDAKGADIPALLATSDSSDLSVESLRSLRTSMQFSLLEAKNNRVVICGPAPGIGKSFVAANLALLLAEAGKRTLVVDADLRRGKLHRAFGGRREPGLSDVIAGAAELQSAVRKTENAKLDFLSSGAHSPLPSELLGSERFAKLLEQASAAYDLVLIDTPPILAVTDAAIVARHAGLTLCVLQSAKHPIREISAALRRFSQSGVTVSGIVMNRVELTRALGRRYAYHYQYTYGGKKTA